MRNIEYKKQNLSIWLEFMVMMGVLLLVVAITLLGIYKSRQLSQNNKIQLEVSLKLQNLMEYCKANKDDLEDCLKHLEGNESYKEIYNLDWNLFYDANWQQVASVQEADYSIEVQIENIPYTYGILKNIILEAYRIEQYNLEEHGMKGSGKQFVLDLESSYIVREEL